MHLNNSIVPMDRDGKLPHLLHRRR